MKSNKLVIALVALAMIYAAASPARADLSQAAVPFLTIAPGARAGAMGEAYVAMADDATATHWNPAGLGAPPLSSSWLEFNIPADFQPLTAVALTSSGAGGGYKSYDVWAITAKGLARYDYKQWNLSEEFNTKRSDQLRNIVRSFFLTNDGTRLDAMTKAAAEFNARMTFEQLKQLREEVMNVIPKDYSAYDGLVSVFDSLETAYYECKVKWDNIGEIRKLLAEGNKDGNLTEQEIDRISFAVEKSRSRFINETVLVPYSAAIPGELTVLGSSGRVLFVGSTEGLAAFDGRQWRLYTTEDKLPSNHITAIATSANDAWVGTDSGIVRFSNLQVVPFSDAAKAPRGEISAIGANGAHVWLASNNQLYHFDGQQWQTSTKYTVLMDDTPETIANRFSLYGSARERQDFIAKFNELNAPPKTASPQSSTEQPPATQEASMEPVGDASMTGDSTMTGEDTTTADSTMNSDSVMVGAEGESEAAKEVTQPDAAQAMPPTPNRLEAGSVVTVPYVAQLRGTVNAIYVEPRGDAVWLGTSYGVARFDGDSWQLFGYENYTSQGSETIIDVIENKGRTGERSMQESVDALRDINDLKSDDLAAGQTVKIFRNPASSPVHSINSRNGKAYFATSDGMLQFDGKNWGRADKKGMGRGNTIEVLSPDHGLWFVNDKALAVQSGGRREFSLMHVQWLPGLVNDVYYEFAGYVHPTEGWGTLGGNVTFITYGTSTRTDEDNNILEEFTSYEIAFTASYGTPLTNNLSGGLSTKLIYSRLAPFGAGLERGDGTSWGFAVDLGLLYQMSSRLKLAAAVLNIGPDIAYSDVKAQSDPLPRTLSLGFAYLLKDTDPFKITIAAQTDKSLIGVNDSFRRELGQMLSSIGGEFSYADVIAFRLGYKYDGEDPDNSIMTVGAGLRMLDWVRVDISYIPSNSTSEAQQNTLRFSLSLMP